ncbi:MAG: ROK family protein [Acidimicrobiales bacterium]
MDQALALDIGGTKLAAAIVDADGTVSHRTIAPTGQHADGEATFALVCELLDQFRPFDRFAALGVGCPGPMAEKGQLVSPLNIPSWRRFPLAARLAEHTGLPTALDGDAKALALAEGWIGAAVGERDFVAMVVSTGVGGGIVLDGRLIDGRLGNAGHVGQIVVNPGGQTLPGQITGSLECEASGTAIALRTGRPATEACTAEIRHVGTMVGRAVGSLANALDLHLAVVGGSVALGLGEPFFASAQAECDRICTLDYSIGTRIEPVGLGVEAPLVGAAAVGFRAIGHDLGGLA